MICGSTLLVRYFLQFIVVYLISVTVGVLMSCGGSKLRWCSYLTFGVFLNFLGSVETIRS